MAWLHPNIRNGAREELVLVRLDHSLFILHLHHSRYLVDLLRFQAFEQAGDELGGSRHDHKAAHQLYSRQCNVPVLQRAEQDHDECFSLA